MPDGTEPVPIEALLAHREWVRRVARALVRDEAGAEDLEQDLWAKVVERPPRGLRSVRAWLGTVLRHRAGDLRRGEAARARHEAGAAAARGGAAEERDLVAEADLGRRVAGAVLALEEPYRSTVLLRWYGDLPPGAIARREGIPVETVRTRLKRALALLRVRLDAGEGRRGRSALLVLAGLPGGALVAKKTVAAAALVLLLAGGIGYGLRSRGPGGTAPSAPSPDPGVPAGAASSSPAPLPPGPDPGGPAPPGPPASPPAGTIAGSVVDSRDRPVAGARVLSIPDDVERPLDPSAVPPEEGPGRETRTGADGRFVLAPGGAAATFTLRAEGPDGGTAVAREVRAGREATLVLEAPAVLAGRVADLAGNPVGGASVRVVVLADRTRVAREGVSDPLGAYRVEGIPGRGDLASVEATAEGRAPAMRVLDPSPEPGEERRLDLALGGLGVLAGCVRDGATGRPVAGARVVLLGSMFASGGPGWVRSVAAGGRVLENPDAWRTFGETATGPDGAYRIEGLPQGGANPYFEVRAGAIAEGWTADLRPVTLGNPGDEVRQDLVLWPAAAIEGRVLEGDLPAAGVTVMAPVAGTESASWFPSVHGKVPTWWTTTDARGRYRLGGVPVTGSAGGKVVVKAFPRSAMFLRGGAVEPGAEVEAGVRAGATAEAPDLRLPAFRAAAVDFLVVDREGRPVGGAEFGAHDSPVQARTDREGRARLLWPPEAAGRAKGAIVRARGFGPEAVALRPAVEEPPVVRVVLGEGRRLRGRVVGGAGRIQVQVANARLPVEEAFSPAVVPPEGDADADPRVPPLRVHASVRGGADGSFVVEDLPEGPWFVRAIEYVPGSGEAPPRSRETRLLTLTGSEAEVLLEFP
jgi:RNA polymerase sigma-70 factor (ECF subfamily)